jgi:hypothetical protein
LPQPMAMILAFQCGWVEQQHTILPEGKVSACIPLHLEFCPSHPHLMFYVPLVMNLSAVEYGEAAQKVLVTTNAV